MANFTIQKRKGKTKVTYTARVRWEGGLKSQSKSQTFSRKTDARVWAKDLVTKLESGKYKVVAAQHNKTSLSELVEEYILAELPRKGQKMIKDQTRQMRWWTNEIGPDTPVTQVNKARVKQAKRVLERKTNPQGNPISHATVNRYLAALSVVFSWAVGEDIVEYNPVSGIPRWSERGNSRTRFLDPTEVENLLGACRDSKQPMLLPLVVLALGTGARKGELLGLRKRDVDLKAKMSRRMVALGGEQPQTDAGLVTFIKTKNGETRSVPIMVQTYDMLKKHMSTSKTGNVHVMSDLVFSSINGKKPLQMKRAWRTALKRAGIENFRFHDLRHTAASWFLMNGTTSGELAEILGHKSLDMVKRYSHLNKEHLAGIVTIMNRSMFQSLSRQETAI